MKTTRESKKRRGYSLTVVLLFLILLMYLWAVVYRTTGSLVRVQTVRVQRDVNDAGMLNAAAQALMYLESHTDLSRTDGPYRYTVRVTNDLIQTWNVDNTVTFLNGGQQEARYTVTLTADGTSSTSWTVEVSAYDTSNPAPDLPSS
jgi:Tfp pilus assembly protein PilX